MKLFTRSCLKHRRIKWALLALVVALSPWLFQKAIFVGAPVFRAFHPAKQQHEEEMNWQVERWAKAKEAEDSPSRMLPDPRFTAQTVAQRKKSLRAQMLKTGVSEREVAAVWRTFEATGIGSMSTIFPVGKPDRRVYILPGWTERRVVRGQPVWMIGSHWEWSLSGGVVPSHVWFVAIRGVWPYDVLASERCE